MGFINFPAECFEVAGAGGSGAEAFVQAGTNGHGAEAFNQSGLSIPETISDVIISKVVAVVRQGFQPSSTPFPSWFYLYHPTGYDTNTDGSGRVYGRFEYKKTYTPDPQAVMDASSPGSVVVPDSSCWVDYVENRTKYDGATTGSATASGVNVYYPDTGGGYPAFGIYMDSGGTFVSGSGEVLEVSNSTFHWRYTSSWTMDVYGTSVPVSAVDELTLTIDRTPAVYMTDLMAAYNSLPALTLISTNISKQLTDAGIVDGGAWPGRAKGSGFSGGVVGLGNWMSLRGSKYQITARNWNLQKFNYTPEWSSYLASVTYEPATLYMGYWFNEPDGTYTEIVPALTYP